MADYDNPPGVGSTGQQREDTTRTLGMLAREFGLTLSEPSEFADVAPIPRSIHQPIPTAQERAQRAATADAARQRTARLAAARYETTKNPDGSITTHMGR